MRRELLRETFRAMGTHCAIAVSGAPNERTLARRALAAARCEIAACERALSRFDPESDLSRLNRAGGEWIVADIRMIEALSASERARAETGGLYDPTILPALVSAGYDRSFELLTEHERAPLDDWSANARIDLDPAGNRARIAPGAAVDLGGIGKGFAATRALGALRRAWPEGTGALVDLGGDIAVCGAPPEGGAWRIDVADPRSPGRVLETLELRAGGVATSGRDTRRFGPAGRLHHLIDPRTGVPATRGPLAVTVVAPTAAEAEAHATALAIADLAEARAQLANRPEISALLIPDTGEAITIGNLPVVRERPNVRLHVNAVRTEPMPSKTKRATARNAATLSLMAIVAVLATACGSSGGSAGSGVAAGANSAASFVQRVTTQFSRGQSGRLWDTLLPADQAVVTRARYTACQSNEGFQLQKFSVLDNYADRIDVGGQATPSTAVSVQVTSDDGTTTATMHAVSVAGKWRWILPAADYAAYKRGACPGA